MSVLIQGITKTDRHDDTTAHEEEEQIIRLVWHRRDLRLHDNELYHDSPNNCNTMQEEDDNQQHHDHDDPLLAATPKHRHPRLKVISLYVFDPCYFQPQTSSVLGGKHNLKTIWCGPHFAQALIDAVTCLRERIRVLGGELLVRIGDPTVIVPEVAHEIGATELCYSEEPGTYECHVAQIKEK